VRKTIFIVSGSFRTGTSMMMRMLGEAGIGLFYTPIRDANPKFNPDGFFEIDMLHFGSFQEYWMNEYGLEGKAIKIFPWRLGELPIEFDYKIIFMQRDIIASMKSTHRLFGNAYSRDDEEKNKKEYTDRISSAKAYIERSSNMQMLEIQYEHLLDNVSATCKKIQEFLSVDMDLEKMACVPDKNKNHAVNSVM
jgi:sulfotransferase family protein